MNTKAISQARETAINLSFRNETNEQMQDTYVKARHSERRMEN